MSRRKRGQPVHGIVLLDKPAGLSSNQALQRVRRIFNAQKAGHTGSLDPFATGMLPICLGEATKTAAFMLDADKAYRASARLGEATTTGDPEGEVIRHGPVPDLAAARIEERLAALIGPLDQVPPMYSALKHQGRPLYEYARRGIEIERPARQVEIREIRLLAWQPPQLDFEVTCSKGTYIRTLGEDIATGLGTCAHLVGLRRSWVAPFRGQPMVKLEELEAAASRDRTAAHLLPPDAGLPDWPVLCIDADRARAFCNGNPVQLGEFEPGRVRVRDTEGRLLGLAECTPEGLLRPRRVLQLQA